MKRILFVLGFVLLASLLFAQANPDPAGEQSMYSYIFQNMYSWQWIKQIQEQPETQNRFMEQARLGDLSKDPVELAVQKEPERRQERSGDCDSDCDGTPDQDQDQNHDREQSKDGSCKEQ